MLFVFVYVFFELLFALLGSVFVFVSVFMFVLEFCGDDEDSEESDKVGSEEARLLIL
jgi:hypothetical protein